MSRRLAVLLVAVLAGLLGGPVSAGHAVSVPTSTARASHLAPTAVIHLRPVTKKGRIRPGYSINGHHGGASCQSGSAVTVGAYRCFAGRFVYDPCWVGVVRSEVLCLGEPWELAVTELNVTKGFSGGRPTGSARLPWGVQLANGQLCGSLAGDASGSVGHRPVHFECLPSKDVLDGSIDRHDKVWTVRRARPAVHGHYAKAGRVQITKAWFGERSRKGHRT